MHKTSPAEAKLDARIRPQITVLPSRAAPRDGRRPEVSGKPARASQRRERASGKPEPIRLTRRGRVVVGVLVAIGVALAGLFWLAVAGQAEASSRSPGSGSAVRGMIRVVVRPGQTLWGIAVHADPSADPRVVISEIVSDNELAGTGVQIGQTIWVPRG